MHGVTFLAFGNGAPDLFSAIAALSETDEGDAGLAVGGLFGEDLIPHMFHMFPINCPSVTECHISIFIKCKTFLL